MSIQTLFQSYGWQLALVALVGTFLTSWLKIPMKYLLKKGTSESADNNFDTAAFVLGFVVAIILGCIYTVTASSSGWLYNVGEDGTKEIIKANFELYISNGFGTWYYQLAYYGIWKKLGAKRLLSLVWSKIKTVFDKNHDGNIDLDEAASFVTGLLKDGKLNIEEVLATLKTIAPSIADDVITGITEEAGQEGTVDAGDSLDKLQQLLEQAMAGLSNDTIASFTTSISEKVSDKAKDLADNPTKVPDSATIKRPEIKF